MKLDSVDKILDYAIDKEQDAADFYNALSDKMKQQYMKDVFSGFAKEELGHKAKLQGVKEGKVLAASEKKILDLKIGDNLSEIEMSAELDYQEALILAMKAEKAAFKLYNDLAEATDDAGARSMLQGLANEEAKHKLRFEVEYDDVILKEN